VGIETFCVTVDRSGHDYLKHMCPDERYMVIEEIESLPAALTKVYERLTAR
jgi:nitric oxide reductase NorD protein